ncbi:MAG: N-6 DNA methylase [Spirochaetaceae bacterium]|nr:N-6 DNA methylase [Spirochaetaceae bacterium]
MKKLERRLNALSTKRNRYFDNEKNHTIFTPPAISKWLREIIEPEMGNVKVVFDPACGSGNLLEPFKDKVTVGCDIEDFGADIDNFIQEDFLSWKSGDYPMDLVNMNPPYNHSKESSKKYGRGSLLPELFADKCFKIFGKDVKMILFTPMGLRLNTRCYSTKQGARYRNIRDNWGPITSIVSLPLDVFPNADFNPEGIIGYKGQKGKKVLGGLKKSNIKRKETQQEILFFNMPKLKPHYCLPDKVIEELRDMDTEAWG